MHLADDPSVFRLVAAAVLLPTGLFILATSRSSPTDGRAQGQTSSRPAKEVGLRPPAISGLAFVVGIVGGIYGIGGGSVLGPILAGTGMTIGPVAPAALASTWVTSMIGVASCAVIALDTPGTIAPDWTLGIATGIGGIFGGYTGARLHPHLPELLLRTVLGLLAIALAVAYLVQALV